MARGPAGIVQSNNEDNEAPALMEIAGAGRIIHHQEMPDGRFLILLQGIGRVRIISEHATDTAYRVVKAELVPNSNMGVDADVTTIRDCLTLLRARVPNLVDVCLLKLATTPAALADLWAVFYLAHQRSARHCWKVRCCKTGAHST